MRKNKEQIRISLLRKSLQGAGERGLNIEEMLTRLNEELAEYDMPPIAKRSLEGTLRKMREELGMQITARQLERQHRYVWEGMSEDSEYFPTESDRETLPILFSTLNTHAGLPAILTGLRVSLVLAWVGAIVGEFIASQHGLGRQILYAGQTYDIALVVPDGADAERVRDIAFRTFDLALGAGLGPLRGKVFRIGHLGFVCDRDVLTAVAAIEATLQGLGLHKGAMGAGVAAAAAALAQG